MEIRLLKKAQGNNSLQSLKTHFIDTPDFKNEPDVQSPGMRVGIFQTDLQDTIHQQSES